MMTSTEANAIDHVIKCARALISETGVDDIDGLRVPEEEFEALADALDSFDIEEDTLQLKRELDDAQDWASYIDAMEEQYGDMDQHPCTQEKEQ